MKNSQYWQKRIDEIAKLQYDKADEAEKELIKAYQRADKYIEERINLYYARYAKENDISLAESKKILSSSEVNKFRMSLDEFIDKAQNNQDDKWTKELNEEYLRSRISRYDALRYEISNKVKELKHEQLIITKSHLQDAYSDTYYRTAYELEKGTGIGVNFAKLNDKAIENAVYTKWLDNKNFAGRMYDDKINLISNLNKIITQGMITGGSSDDMVNRLMKATKISRNRAINLIQTETTFIIGKANTDMYKEFGIEEYDVIETLDNVTCETCSAMDGKRFKVSEKQEGLNAPPFHTRCRGTTIPVTKYENIWGKGDRIARDENGKTYYKTDIGNIAYEEYIENKLNNKEKNDNMREYIVKTYDNYKAVNERKSIKKAMKDLPKKHRDLLSDIQFNVIMNGNSSYNRKTNIVNILKGSDEYEVLHELAHVIETKLNLYNDITFIKILENKINVYNPFSIKTDTSYSLTIDIIESDKFISKYQGRIYEYDSNGDFRIDYTSGKINVKALGEYFAEGYKEYFRNADNLKRKDIDLYKFIERLIK